MSKLRILVCGGRDFDNRSLMYQTLDDIAWEFGQYYTEDGTNNRDQNWLPSFYMIAGAAPGADTHAYEYAVVNWLDGKEYPADWNKHGKAAGPIRNQQMLDEGKPDLVVAFPTKNSKGTWDMVERARKAGIPVRIIETN